jgi:hypothetical protein
MINSNRLCTWERRVQECKKKHRPKLSNWERDGFGTRRAQEFDELQVKYHEENSVSIERISQDQLTVEEFIHHYERNSIPLIITGIPEGENWRAGKV